jgi:hypothetical protein
MEIPSMEKLEEQDHIIVVTGASQIGDVFSYLDVKVRVEKIVATYTRKNNRRQIREHFEWVKVSVEKEISS